jgi:transcriptional regulator GlxA family with amidase domain
MNSRPHARGRGEPFEGARPQGHCRSRRIPDACAKQRRSRHPIDVIARQTGFADRGRMRCSFLRAIGQPSQVIRRNARVEAAA